MSEPIEIIIDKDGYPLDECLQQMNKHLKDIDQDHRAYVRNYLEQMLENSIYASGGFEKDGLFRFSTGGWSGNEDFIHMLHSETMVEMLYLAKWERGGHWYYDFKGWK